MVGQLQPLLSLYSSPHVYSCSHKTGLSLLGSAGAKRPSYMPQVPPVTPWRSGMRVSVKPKPCGSLTRPHTATAQEARWLGVGDGTFSDNSCPTLFGKQNWSKAPIGKVKPLVSSGVWANPRTLACVGGR